MALQEMSEGLSQQAAVSALGSLALQGLPVAELFDEAARVLYETLASDLIVVLEDTGDGAASIRASAGEDPSISPLPAREPRSVLGLVWDTGETLLTSDLPSETHFRAPALAAVGIVSLVAAPMRSGAAAFGVLLACSRRRAAFSDDDLAFVESTANVLMAAVERERAAALAAKDITERYEQQALATRRTEQLDDAQRLARIGSWETDFASGLHTLSESLREMLALDSCLITGDVFLARVHPEQREQIRAVIATPEEGTAEFQVVLPEGRIRTFRALFRLLCDAAGDPIGMRGTVKDVTATRRSEANLRRSEERFRQGFENAPIAMVLVDPTSLRFVRVNDAFCSMVGRTRDALDELTFADISHPDEVSHCQKNVRRLIAGELDHYVTDKRYVRPDSSQAWASINITPVRDPDGNIDILFGQMVDITERKAREAALHAELDDIAGLGEIRRAFQEDRFELHAQPIIDLATGETVQRELLIRMRDSDGKLIPPSAFLPAAEKHGAIRAIDRWVIAKAADIAAGGIDLAINISAASIGDPELVANIEQELARTGADPSRLVFEITETALIAETDVAVTLAERLRQLGCRFALDDFGSGYGCFHYLKHLPMDFLKIDSEFIRDARASVADQHVIRAIVGLARGFGLQTIAEGVQDQKTLDMLREFGVDYAQGFHLGRPAPLVADACSSP
jgi:PAS domain S-box-containing protein